MIKAAITGNLGSGKSTVTRIFTILGAPVYDADAEAKKFLKDDVVVGKLTKAFGEDILSGGQVDRKKLASIVFNNPEALKFLNSIIHPLVKQDLHKWLERHASFPYVLQEAAILFESGFHKEFDRIIVVACPPELALQRVMDRDGVSESDVRSRMKNQWPQDEKIRRADYVIHNDSRQLVIPQVLEIHKKLSGK